MANANRGLGRGLGALLGDAALQTESADSLYLPISQVESCAGQPRSNDYYHVTDHLYLSILAEVFRNRTYTRWCKGIKRS